MNPKSLVNQLIAPLVVASAIAGPAHAQAPTKAAAAATTPAANPAAAPAAPVTPEQRAAIRGLLETTHARESFAAYLQGFSQSMRAQMGQMITQRIATNATLSNEQKQQVLASLQQPFENTVVEGQKLIGDPKLVDDVMERLVAIDARTFSLDEIRQINTFYKSPVGQKALTAIPASSREAVQGTMSGVAPKIDALIDSIVQKQIDAVTKGAASAPAPAKAAPTKK